MKTSLRNRAAVVAALALAGSLGLLVVGGWSVPTQGASTRTIVAQSVYVCQSKPQGMPAEDYDVTLRISLKAPSSVAPGQTVSLSGTATLQFPEKAYQEGKQIGETEADGYSDTLSIATTANGRTTDVPANRWQTAPFPWRDPVVISAPITLHPFTVPSDASGSLTITLPRNERRAPNTATDSPATVAWNGVANNKTAAGNVPEDLACYLQGAAPSVLGTIPISSRAAAPRASTSNSTKSNPASPGDAAAQPGSATAGGAVPPGTSSGSPRAGTAPNPMPNARGEVAGAPASGMTMPADAALSPASSPRSGVFVSTNVLLLAGGLICIAALGYALLAQYRLRILKRAVDGR